MFSEVGDGRKVRLVMVDGGPILILAMLSHLCRLEPKVFFENIQT